MIKEKIITSLYCTIKELHKKEAEAYTTLEKIKFPSGFYITLEYITYELLTNVKEHAICANVELVTELNKNKHIEIDIKDDGQGIVRSFLSAGIYVKDESSAIEMALAGISAKGKNEYAFGLFSIRKITEHTKGTMIIQTGTIKAIYKKQIRSIYQNAKPVKGTQVFISLPVQKSICMTSSNKIIIHKKVLGFRDDALNIKKEIEKYLKKHKGKKTVPVDFSAVHFAARNFMDEWINVLEHYKRKKKSESFNTEKIMTLCKCRKLLSIAEKIF